MLYFHAGKSYVPFFKRTQIQYNLAQTFYSHARLACNVLGLYIAQHFTTQGVMASYYVNKQCIMVTYTAELGHSPVPPVELWPHTLLLQLLEEMWSALWRA